MYILHIKHQKPNLDHKLLIEKKNQYTIILIMTWTSKIRRRISFHYPDPDKKLSNPDKKHINRKQRRTGQSRVSQAKFDSGFQQKYRNFVVNPVLNLLTILPGEHLLFGFTRGRGNIKTLMRNDVKQIFYLVKNQRTPQECLTNPHLEHAHLIEILIL